MKSKAVQFDDSIEPIKIERSISIYTAQTANCLLRKRTENKLFFSSTCVDLLISIEINFNFLKAEKELKLGNTVIAESVLDGLRVP